jgi:hypothetical protein
VDARHFFALLRAVLGRPVAVLAAKALGSLTNQTSLGPLLIVMAFAPESSPFLP